jgi:hypothetical protein
LVCVLVFAFFCIGSNQKYVSVIHLSVCIEVINPSTIQKSAMEYDTIQTSNTDTIHTQYSVLAFITCLKYWSEILCIARNNCLSSTDQYKHPVPVKDGSSSLPTQ